MTSFLSDILLPFPNLNDLAKQPRETREMTLLIYVKPHAKLPGISTNQIPHLQPTRPAKLKILGI